MRRNLYSRFAPILALLCISLGGQQSDGQTSSPAFALRSGQSMYIVAFNRVQPYNAVDAETNANVNRPGYSELNLDAERKVRKRIEEWGFFRVADKPSDADFVFLVNLDDSSIEGLAIPFEAYRQHFKDNFDLDSLRDAAYARYLIGPLKLATISRLSDRLVKQFREDMTKGGKTAR
jgi:hypothetical protein